MKINADLLGSIKEKAVTFSSADEAYEYFKKQTGIPSDVATAFYNKYVNENDVVDSQKKAFTRLYNEAKLGDGNWVTIKGKHVFLEPNETVDEHFGKNIKTKEQVDKRIESLKGQKQVALSTRNPFGNSMDKAKKDMNRINKEMDKLIKRKSRMK